MATSGRNAVDVVRLILGASEKNESMLCLWQLMIALSWKWGEYFYFQFVVSFLRQDLLV